MTAFEDLAKKWTDAFNKHDARAVARTTRRTASRTTPSTPSR